MAHAERTLNLPAHDENHKDPAVAEPLLLEPSGSLAEATAEAERWALGILIAVHLLWVALPVGLLIRAEVRGRPLSGAL